MSSPWKLSLIYKQHLDPQDSRADQDLETELHDDPLEECCVRTPWREDRVGCVLLGRDKHKEEGEVETSRNR
jgi:hypothetical protein